MTLSVATMRAIDGIAGPIACLVARPLSLLLGRKQPVSDPRRIVFLKFFGMGSILLATPLIRQIRARFPEAKLMLTTFSGNRELAESIGLFDEILTVDTSGISAFVRDTLGAWRRFLAMRPDLTIDLEFFSNYSSLLSCLSMAPVRLGFASLKRFRSWLFTHTISYESGTHIVHRFLHFVRFFDIAPEPPSLEPLRVTDADLDLLRRLLGEDWRESAGRAVVVSIASSEMFSHRCWPLERFAKLADRIQAEFGAGVILIGGPEFAPHAEQALDMMKNRDKAVDLVGKLSFGALFALLQGARVFVGNDSGPVHIASAAGIRTVGLYGPETPLLYGPLAPGSRAITADLFCSPCLNVYKGKSHRCVNNVCMQRIEVDEVFEAVSDLYGAGE